MSSPAWIPGKFLEKVPLPIEINDMDTGSGRGSGVNGGKKLQLDAESEFETKEEKRERKSKVGLELEFDLAMSPVSRPSPSDSSWSRTRFSLPSSSVPRIVTREPTSPAKIFPKVFARRSCTDYLLSAGAATELHQNATGAALRAAGSAGLTRLENFRAELELLELEDEMRRGRSLGTIAEETPSEKRLRTPRASGSDTSDISQNPKRVRITNPKHPNPKLPKAQRGSKSQNAKSELKSLKSFVSFSAHSAHSSVYSSVRGSPNSSRRTLPSGHSSRKAYPLSHPLSLRSGSPGPSEASLRLVCDRLGPPQSPEGSTISICTRKNFMENLSRMFPERLVEVLRNNEVARVGHDVSDSKGDVGGNCCFNICCLLFLGLLVVLIVFMV